MTEPSSGVSGTTMVESGEGSPCCLMPQEPNSADYHKVQGTRDRFQVVQNNKETGLD